MRTRPIRWISLVVTVALLWQFGGGAIYAQARLGAGRARSVPHGLTRGAAGLEEALARLERRLRQPGRDRAQAALDRVRETSAGVEESLDQVRALLVARGVGAQALERHDGFARGTLRHLDALRRILDGPAGERSGALERFLDEGRSSPPTADPTVPHHRSLRARGALAPRLTTDAWREASVGEAGTTLLVGETSSGKTAAAGAGDAPTAADLAETVDVRFTPEITQLAADLGDDPVAIFNWVRNHIEFVPVWGSIQGAQLCLSTRICNAFDTSSLLIALLRASGIASRYQLGTIEVNAADAMNWLGGFTDAAAAARFAASGGTPSAGTVEAGGAVTALRMEHVWVRAYVDYIPSQGAVHVDGDTWVDLDPSYKLHDRTPDTDAAAAVGFDLQAVIQELEAAATLDPAAGTIAGVDTALIDSAAADLLTAITEAYQGVDPATLFSSEAIRPRALPLLAATTPYRTLARGPEVAAIPDALRHSMTVRVTGDDGTEHLSHTAWLPAVAGEPLSLAYDYATPADLGLVRTLVPPEVLDPAVGSLQEFLDRIPAYLVDLRPVLQRGGVPLAGGAPVGMGRQQRVSVSFQAPTVSTGEVSFDTVAWGRYALVLDHGGTSASALQEQAADLQARTNAVLASGDPAAVAGLMSRSHDLVGAAWFFGVNHHARRLQGHMGVRFARYPSLAFAFANSTASSLFGVPSRVSVAGYFLDAARQLQVATALDGDASREAEFTLKVGMGSSLLEGLVLPLLSGGTFPAAGFSAAGALAEAVEQGIPVYVINALNEAVTLPAIDDRYPRDAIADAVRVGRTVIVAQQPPLIDGVPALGYVALDPATGEGAYLLERARGGWMPQIICRGDLSDAETRACAAWWTDMADAIAIVVGAISVALLMVAVGLAVTNAVLLLATTLSGLAAAVLTAEILNAATGALADYAACITSGGLPGDDTCFNAASHVILGELLNSLAGPIIAAALSIRSDG